MILNTQSILIGCLPLTHLFCVADLDHVYSEALMKVFFDYYPALEMVFDGFPTHCIIIGYTGYTVTLENSYGC